MKSLQRKIVHLTRASWILATAKVCLVGGFAFFAFVPMTSQMRTLDQNIAEQHKELALLREQTRELPNVEAEVVALRAKVRDFQMLPQNKELTQFIRDTSQLAQEASIRRLDHRPGTPSRGEKLTEQPIQLSFEGDFIGVYTFLRGAEELQRLTRVPKISIKSPDKSGQVRVNLTMNLYCAAE
jgi:Tfp pilus assembly protein PilO